MLGTIPSRTSKEQEPIVIIRKNWEYAREQGRKEGLARARAEGFAEGRAEGFAEGFAEGLAEGFAGNVLIVLRARGIPVPDAVRERILAEKDPERQQLWLERAVIMTSLAEVLGELS